MFVLCTCANAGLDVSFTGGMDMFGGDDGGDY